MQLDKNEKFENVVFTDECTVQLDHHGRLCFRKEKEQRLLKQRPKHAIKVHIWGEVSNTTGHVFRHNECPQIWADT